MFAGSIPYELSFFRFGGGVSFPPDDENGGQYTWRWKTLYDTGLEAHLCLERECYVGAVCLKMAEKGGALAVRVFADGRCAGALDASRTPVRLGKRPLLNGDLVIPVRARAVELVLRFEAELADISFAAPEVLGAYEDGQPFFWPVPLKWEAAPGEDVAAGSIHALGGTDAMFAAQDLRRRFAEEGIGLAEGGAEVLLEEDERFTDERCRVEITKERIRLTAGSRLTLLYAAEILLQCAREGRFAPGIAEDRPAHPMRGFHLGLPPREELPFFRRFLRYVLIPLRYNQVFLEFAGGMRFDRHPEISEAWLKGNRAAREGKQPAFPHGSMNAGGELLEKDEVRALAEDVREMGLELIPEVQSLSHVQYITWAHPEIAEREEGAHAVSDTRAEDARPADFYAHCYCPSNPESLRIIFDIIDEIVEVTRPARFVHMGHDEVYQIGVCPVCKGQDPARLYARHVTRVHDYLAKKGLKMMIWADMLQPTERYLTYPAREMIPKDILLLDFIWYFHFDLDMEDHLLPYGFSVLMGNLYSSHYPRYSARADKKNMLGGEVSTWCRFDEETLAELGKFWDVMLTAQMLWSRSFREEMRPVYTRMLTSFLQPRMRAALRGTARCAADPVSLPLPPGDASGIPEEVLARFPSAIRADGVRIPVGRALKSLRFCHTALFRLPCRNFEALERTGEYVVRYADGAEETVPVKYNGNIICLNTAYAEPLPQQFYRHRGYVGTWQADPVFEGKDGDGRDLLVLGLDWENPRPEAVIADISFRAARPDLSVTVLAELQAEE